MQWTELANRFARTGFFKALAVIYGVFCLILVSVGVYTYGQYSRMIDQRLNGHLFENTAKIYDGSGKLLTSLSGESRAKRRLVEFQDVPRVLIDAVTAG